MVDRRAFLLQATAIGGAVARAGPALAPDRFMSDEPPLRARAAARGLFYGASVVSSSLRNDPDFARAIVAECAMIVADYEFKWKALQPRPGDYDFTAADGIAAFARSNSLSLRGHTLLWYKQLPDWMPTSLDAAATEKLIRTHVATVTGHFRGRVHSWDVVNEAVLPEDGRDDGLRRSLWLDAMGDTYIDLAFRLARDADPAALLTYNDFGIDADTSTAVRRRKAILRLLERLKKNGVPIDAFGTQSHLWSDQTNITAGGLGGFLHEVAQLGLKIIVTELDVRDKPAPAAIPARDAAVASQYERYLDIVLAEPAVIGVLTWGLSDRHTWVTAATPRRDGLPVRPLPLDANLGRKPAWFAIARAFDRAPMRR